MVADATVALAAVDTRGPAAQRHPGPQGVGRVDDSRRLHRRGPEGRRRAHDTRSHAHDGELSARHVAGEGQCRGHRHRLEVAAEGVPGGDGGVDDPPCPQAMDQVGERERQGGAVGHDVGDAGRGPQASHHRGHHADLAV